MRNLQRADRAALLATAAVFLTYSVSGAAYYFADGHMPHALLVVLTLYMPWALAAAVDMLGFLVGWRVNAALRLWLHAARGSQERERARSTLLITGGILAAILVFSAYNGLAYLWGSGWRAQPGPLALPGILPYLVRAAAPGAGFVAATLLTEVEHGLTESIHHEGQALAWYALRTVRTQWRNRVRRLHKGGHDLTPLLIELTPDGPERELLSTIYRGIHPELEASQAVPAVPALSALSALSAAASGQEPALEPEPEPEGDGPGSPGGAGGPGGGQPVHHNGHRTRTPAEALQVLSLPVPPEWRQARSGTRGSTSSSTQSTQSTRRRTSRGATIDVHGLQELAAEHGLVWGERRAREILEGVPGAYKVGNRWQAPRAAALLAVQQRRDGTALASPARAPLLRAVRRELTSSSGRAQEAQEPEEETAAG